MSAVSYTCKECGAPVERKPDNEFVRQCKCVGGINAYLKARATGEAKIAQGKPH